MMIKAVMCVYSSMRVYMNECRMRASDLFTHEKRKLAAGFSCKKNNLCRMHEIRRASLLVSIHPEGRHRHFFLKGHFRTAPT